MITNMHLYRPQPPYFVGDCMPFYQDGVFHLFYLLDEDHHQGNGGLGGHQWANASTRDLVHWQHHPLALPIVDPSEASICTGSVFWHDRMYYAFYATRRPDWTQHLCLATSNDGVHFEKDSLNPFLSAPEGYSKVDLRDPVVFQDHEGLFHLLATSKLEPFLLDERGGCLLHLTSPDLHQWTVDGPFFTPGGPPGYACIPECPDYFAWNGWYYLLYSQDLQTHYRFSRNPFGPWQKPAVDLLDSPLASVMKTCPIWDNRRIGAAFIGERKGQVDHGAMLWAGSTILRELMQHPDGTLSTHFVPETLTTSTVPFDTTIELLTPGVTVRDRSIFLDAAQSQEAAALRGIGQDFYLKCRIYPQQDHSRFGIGLRGSGNMQRQYELAFEPVMRRVTLQDQVIQHVTQFEQPFWVEIHFQGDIVEVCIDHQRCLINRLGELKGDTIFFFCEHGSVTFKEFSIFPS